MSRRALVVAVGVVALVTAFTVATAQSVQAIEDQVRYYLDRINKYPSVSKAHSGGGEDSLEYYNRSLRTYLKDMLVREPHTLEYGFGKLGWRMTIATSNDKKFRIYSWDEGTGRTVHRYSSVLQYKAGEQVKSFIYHASTYKNGEPNTPGYYYPKIYQITGLNTWTYYVAERRATQSDAVYTLGIQCFAIETFGVNDSIKLIEGNGELVNNIDIEVDRTQILKDKKAEIQFLSNNRILYVPLPTDGRITKRRVIYEFNGEYYAYMKTAD